MRQHLLLWAAIASLSAVGGLATAQNTQPQNTQQSAPLDQPQTIQLTPQQKQSVDEGLNNQRMQSSQSGSNAQVGMKAPGDATGQKMPNNVAEQVPQTEHYLFIKLPDRVLLIDPDSDTVAEIIPHPFIFGAPSTTGSAPPNKTDNR
jgi:hypothetical protein